MKPLDQRTDAMHRLIAEAKPLPPLGPTAAMVLMYAGIGVGETIANMVKGVYPEDAALYLTAIAGCLRDELAHGWSGDESQRQQLVELYAAVFSEALTGPPLSVSFSDTAQPPH